MRRAPSQSLLGPALLLYLVADAAAAQGQLDWVGALCVVLAGTLALAPAAMARKSELAGSQRVGAVGLAAAYGLVRAIAPDGLSLAVEVTAAFGAASAAALVLDLALTVPDRLGSIKRARALRSTNVALAVVAAAFGAVAHAPAVVAFRQLWIAPAWCACVPFVYASAAVAIALIVRLMRRRLGSTPEALASNAWAILGLFPAACAGAAITAAWWLLPDHGAPMTRVAAAVGVALLLWSHFRLVDPSRRLSFGPTIRNALPAVLALGAVAAACALSRPWWPPDPLVFGVAAACVLLGTFALHRMLLEFARIVLAPASGRLLVALERGHIELGEVGDLEGVARVALGTARAGSGSPDTDPRLYFVDPVLGLRADAAGVPHGDVPALHPQLLRMLRAAPSEIIVRAPLEAQIVRMPSLRPVIEALSGLDALCVLPLVQQGELEGALVVPRGPRTSQLALEELEALRRFGRHLSGFVAVLCADARAQRRATDARVAETRVQAELAAAQTELLRLSRETRALRADFALDRLQAPLVTYSAAMRAQIAVLTRHAAASAPILLVAERGLPCAELAQLVHTRSPRAAQPFVIGECAALRPEHSAAWLLGTAGDPTPGMLRLTAEGTLLLCDLTALPLPLQATLARALRDRRVTLAEDDAYTCGARIIATCRRDPEQLVTEGALDKELFACFATRVRVPPLRERREDLPSLLLLALDAAARVLGRAAVGIEPNAQQRLLAYDWPGNLEELHAWVELAVARCTGPRIALADLPALGPKPAAPKESGHPLDGTLERVERRVLVRALERTGGNKSEAARLLGLPRTTFLDKLRRYELEDGTPARDRSSN